MLDTDVVLGAVRRAKVAREARFATQDAKRRKMREDLEKRERTVAAARDEEAAARAKLKVRREPSTHFPGARQCNTRTVC